MVGTVFRAQAVLMEQLRALSSGDLIAIVAIHATMLTVILGILSAYGLYVYGKLDDLRGNVFTEATRINDLPDAGKTGLPFDTAYISSDRAVRERLLNRVGQIGQGSPGDEADQGDELLRIVSALGSYWPFPAAAGPDGALRPQGAEPIRLVTIGEVRRWASDMDRGVRLLAPWELFSSRFQEVLGAASRRFHGQELAKLNEGLARFIAEAATPGQAEDRRRMAQLALASWLPRIAAGFFDNLGKAKEIVGATRQGLRELDGYQDLQPPTWVLLGGIGVSAAGLCTGVLYPITWWVWSGTATLPYLGAALSVPTIAYVLILCYALWIAVRAAMRPGTG